MYLGNPGVACVRGFLGEFALAQRCARLMCCVWGVLGHLVLDHRCVRPVCCVSGVLCLLALVG